MRILWIQRDGEELPRSTDREAYERRDLRAVRYGGSDSKTRRRRAERFGVMGRAENRNRAQSTAAHLAKASPFRTHSACPWGCGAMIKNGGERLLEHLRVCRGNSRRDSRDRRSMV